MDVRQHFNSAYCPELHRQPVIEQSRAQMAEIVKRNDKLVRRIAWQVCSRSNRRIEVEDLIQIGCVALIESANTFVDRGEAQFSTYATMRVRGAMIDELRRTATISRGAIRLQRDLASTRSKLASDLGRQPDDLEMAQGMKITVLEYHSAEASTHGIEYASIDDAYSDQSEWFVDWSTPDAYSVLEASSAGTAVNAAVETLSEREQLVLRLFFVEERSLGEIGVIMKVGAARVCQIKKAALARMRLQLGGWNSHCKATNTHYCCP